MSHAGMLKIKPPSDDKKQAPTLPFKFKKWEDVEHLKTESVYTIVGLPDEYVLEKTGEPAYAYRTATSPIYVRCQKEMEDGRFEAIEIKIY